MLEQRSKGWFEARKGKFTASEIYRLLGKDGLKKTKDSINNFALEKAIESVFGIEDMEDDFLSYDLQRGIELEPLAFEKFKDIKSADFIFVKESTFIEYGKSSGGSPDGEVSDNSVLEIKCPRRTKFYKIIATNEIEPKHYAQMQMQMLCTNTEKCYYFNYIIENGVEKWHEIEVLKDIKMSELINKRINIATIIRDVFIDELLKNKQF